MLVHGRTSATAILYLQISTSTELGIANSLSRACITTLNLGPVCCQHFNLGAASRRVVASMDPGFMVVARLPQARRSKPYWGTRQQSLPIQAHDLGACVNALAKGTLGETR
jgi:hypothetical protein